MRWMDGVKRTLEERNELAERVDRNVLRWFGHVERMDNDRLLKRVMNTDVEGERKAMVWMDGWMDGVKKAVNEW